VKFLRRRSSSLLDSVVDITGAIEHNSRTTNFVIAVAGAIGTAVLWWVHLTHPGTFPDPVYDGGHSNAARLIIGLAPPFLTIFALAHAVLPSAEVDPSGPMSSYLKQQASGRLWKISIIAGVIAAVNLLFLIMTSISPGNS
jgi:hypothetical protein